jgi:HSP20 family protein
VLKSRMLLTELNDMKQRMDALYTKNFSTQARAEQEAECPAWQPSVDVWETEEEWVIFMDLPGVSEGEIQIEVLENRLTIAGTRQTRLSEQDLRASYDERPSGRFSRAFALPHGVKQDQIAAKLKQGVLIVWIPKDQCSGPSPSQKVVVQSE